MSTIFQTIILQPESLGCLQSTILDHLKDKLVGHCNQKYGYIESLQYETLSHVNKPIISRNSGSIICKVKIKANIIKPVKGQVLQATIDQIYSQGIQASCKTISIFISSSQCKLKYNDKTNTMSKNNKEIKIGDKINITIIVSRFSKGIFSCIGKLK